MTEIPKKYARRLAALTLFAALNGCASWFDTTEPAADSASPDAAEQAQACRDAACRGRTTIKLKLASGELLQRQFDWFNPVVQGTSISILPGEELFIEAEERDGFLVDLKQVERNENPAKTLVLKFWQDPGQVDMVLAVSNPFGKHLKYRLNLMGADSDTLSPASSCPVLPGGSAYEYWPRPIIQLLLSEPRLIAGEKPACEY